MKVSIIIPSFNSEKIIINSINRIQKKLKIIKKVQYELIIIDDGSTDNSKKLLKKIERKNIKTIYNSKNLGKSSSLIKGIKRAKYQRIIIWDCDLPYFYYFDKLLKLMKSKDFIYIDRRSKNSYLESKKLNFYQYCRYIISNIVCGSINHLILKSYLGDTQAGLKGFRKPKNFNNLNFISKKFFLDAELMILFSNANLKMQSISLKYKIYEDSTIKIFSLQNFIYLAELFKVIFRYKLKKTKKIKF
jgi:glycosyltransferase involved in cell wall biosynthesis|tara:strand:- start:4119 stop:4856 length:738 start_codon:yes stop_codon:yes gene_type:complete